MPTNFYGARGLGSDRIPAGTNPAGTDGLFSSSVIDLAVFLNRIICSADRSPPERHAQLFSMGPVFKINITKDEEDENDEKDENARENPIVIDLVALGWGAKASLEFKRLTSTMLNKKPSLRPTPEFARGFGYFPLGRYQLVTQLKCT